LLLDTTGFHHHREVLSTKDEFVTVKNFPFNVKELMQPMDRGIIACFKRMHRKELLETLMSLPLWYTGEELIDNHKKLTMWDCCRIIHDAWSSVDDEILKNVWDMLDGSMDESMSAFCSDLLKKDVDEALALLHRLPGCEESDEDGVSKWFLIETISDILMTICSYEVFRDFKNNTLEQVNTGTVRDEDMPSHS
jgi:hypothetical protein